MSNTIKAPVSSTVTVLTELDVLKDKLSYRQHGNRRYRDGSELPTAVELLRLINEVTK